MNSRKRIFALVMSLMMALTYMPALSYADTDATDSEPNTIHAETEAAGASLGKISVSAGSDNELLEQYFTEQVNITKPAEKTLLRKPADATRGSKLTGAEAVIYAQLKTAIEKIANGEIEDPTIYVPLADILDGKLEYSAQELGLESVFDGNDISDEAVAAMDALCDFNSDAVINALLYDLPYDFYWFDKTETGSYLTGISCGFAAREDDTGEYISFDGDNPSFYFVFAVSENYKGSLLRVEPLYDGSTFNVFAVDTALTKIPAEAAANARKIMDNYKDYSDSFKLHQYEGEICSRVTYNEAASEDASIPYGDPWQMIWVFDDDPDTNVVCEGYSKAFQFLCDNTDFKGDVSCDTVTGTMDAGSGFGDHMWNILHMEDGKNYIADLTNSDTGFIGEGGRLFLSGALPYESYDSYSYDCDEDGVADIYYAYDSFAKDAYTEEELTVSTESYEAPIDSSWWHINRTDTNTTVNYTDGAKSVELVVLLDTGEYTTNLIADWYAGNDGNVSADTPVYSQKKGEGDDFYGFDYQASTGYDTYQCIIREVDSNGSVVQSESVTFRLISNSGDDPSGVTYVPAKKPTCQETGNTEYWIRDGKYYTDKECTQETTLEEITLEKSDHTWTEWWEDRPKSCREPGLEIRDCIVCGEREQRETGRLEHTPDVPVIEHDSEASCTDDGYYDEVVYCKVCGDEISREHFTIPAKGHTPGDTEIQNIIAGSCTVNRVYEEVIWCAVCKQEISRVRKTEIATGHDWDDGTIYKEPTETEEGEVNYQCRKCGENRYEKIPPLHHDHVMTHTAASESTCTKDGSKEFWQCSSCGKIYSDPDGKIETTMDDVRIPFLGHDWDDGAVTDRATPTSAGVMTYKCKRCGQFRTEAIPQLPADYAPINTDAENAVMNAEGTLIYGSDKEAAEAAENALTLANSTVAEAEKNVKAAQEAYDKASDADKKAAEEALMIARQDYVDAQTTRAKAQSVAKRAAAKAAANKANASAKTANSAASGTDDAVNKAQAAVNAAQTSAEAAAQAESAAREALDAVIAAGYGEESEEYTNAHNVLTKAESEKIASDNALAAARSRLNSATSLRNAKKAEYEDNGNAYVDPALPKVSIKTPSKGKKSATVKWKKLSKKNQKKVKGVEIECSLDKNFRTGNVFKTGKKTKTSQKIKKLQSKKTYYVRMHTYVYRNGVKYVSPWSKTKKVKIK